jgi:hypothetical protein
MGTPPSASRFPDRLARRLALAASFVFAVVGCTSERGNDPNVPDEQGALAADSASGLACVAALPKTCPKAPSYATEIGPLTQRTCVPCHSHGGVASDRDLTTYKNLTRLETTAFIQVNECLMPPADAGPDVAMTHEERTELLQWFVCGSPNN